MAQQKKLYHSLATHTILMSINSWLVWSFRGISLTCAGKWFWCRQLLRKRGGKKEKWSHFSNINIFVVICVLTYCDSSCRNRIWAGRGAGGRHRGCLAPSLLLQECLHCGQSATRLLFWRWKGKNNDKRSHYFHEPFFFHLLINYWAKII